MTSEEKKAYGAALVATAKDFGAMPLYENAEPGADEIPIAFMVPSKNLLMVYSRVHTAAKTSKLCTVFLEYMKVAATDTPAAPILEVISSLLAEHPEVAELGEGKMT